MVLESLGSKFTGKVLFANTPAQSGLAFPGKSCLVTHSETALLLLKTAISGDQTYIEHLYRNLTPNQIKAAADALRETENE